MVLLCIIRNAALSVVCVFVKDTATTEIYTNCHTLSLHDALPISPRDIAEPFENIELVQRIETGQRLIRKQPFRLPRKHPCQQDARPLAAGKLDRKSTRLNSSH